MSCGEGIISFSTQCSGKGIVQIQLWSDPATADAEAVTACSEIGNFTVSVLADPEKEISKQPEFESEMITHFFPCGMFRRVKGVKVDGHIVNGNELDTEIEGAFESVHQVVDDYGRKQPGYPCVSGGKNKIRRHFFSLVVDDEFASETEPQFLNG